MRQRVRGSQGKDSVLTHDGKAIERREKNAPPPGTGVRGSRDKEIYENSRLTAFNFDCTLLPIHWKVLKLHGTTGSDGESHAAHHITI